MTKPMQLGRLFSPLRIKSMELKNRIVMPPMTTLLAGPGGEITDRFMAFYAARAQGGAALITAETADVHPYTHNLSIGDRGFTAIYDDRFIPGFRRFTDRLHAAGAKVSLQLHHSGGAMMMLDPSCPPVAPSAIPCPGGAVPRALAIDEIQGLVEAFGAGARRAREAGFDAVDIHGGHGYLIAQFMSPYFNRRADRYGADISGRLRFAIEVLRAVRRNVGGDFPVIFRFSADERVPGGRTTAESAVIAPLLVEAGADCLSITTGMHFTLLYTVAAMGMPQGLNVESAAAIKSAVGVPVMVAGKLNDPVLAESVLAAGKADLIAIGRGLIADPELPNKLKNGRSEDIRWCIACNQGCIGGMIAGLPFTCLVNPEAGQESEPKATPAARAKRVLVAGGGPAGMEAARSAALRGHTVVLYERDEQLGGQFLLAAVPPRKHEIAPYLRYIQHQLTKLGVEVVLGQALTPSIVEAVKPDVVIVATGSQPLIPDVPGINAAKVVTAHDVLAGKVVTGQRVLVVGGGQVGCETAEFLDRYGKQVTVVEMRYEIAPDVFFVPRAALIHAFEQTQVTTMTATTVVEITSDSVVLERDGQRHVVRDIETVVLAAGVRPVSPLAEAVKNLVSEVHVIGDAGCPGSAMDAIAAGAGIGRQI
ncbi:MAG TPA: FAD-dependent oxidoreductase [Candidatus Binatia bacterium]